METALSSARDWAKDNNRKLSEADIEAIEENTYSHLDSFQEYGKVSEVQFFTDNFMVNFDFYTEAEEVLSNIS